MKSLTALVILLASALEPASAALAEPALPPGAMPERVMGNAEAKVTIIEYASLTCPHCAKFHKETLPRLKVEYRADFPLNLQSL